MRTLKAIVVGTDRPPEVRDVEDDFTTYQKVVGGYIEGIITGDFTMYVNEEGVLDGLPLNRVATAFIEDATGRGLDIYGPVIILGPPDSEGNDTSVLPHITENNTLKEN